MVSTYITLLNKKREILESQYANALVSKNKKLETAVIKELLKYGLVNKDDSRITDKKKVKEYKKYWKNAAKDIDSYCNQDLIPKNLLFNSPSSIDITVYSEKHWMKRVELQYEGDIIADDMQIRYIIAEQTNKTCALGSVRGMEKLYKDLFNSELRLNKEEVECGCTRVYKVALENGVSFRIRVLGYLYVVPKNKGVEIDILLDHKNMIDLCIDVKSTYESLERKVRKELKKKNIQVVKFNRLADVDSISKYQKSIARREPTFDIYKVQNNKEGDK